MFRNLRMLSSRRICTVLCETFQDAKETHCRINFPREKSKIIGHRGPSPASAATLTQTLSRRFVGSHPRRFVPSDQRTLRRCCNHRRRSQMQASSTTSSGYYEIYLFTNQYIKRKYCDCTSRRKMQTGDVKRVGNHWHGPQRSIMVQRRLFSTWGFQVNPGWNIVTESLLKNLIFSTFSSLWTLLDCYKVCRVILHLLKLQSPSLCERFVV